MTLVLVLSACGGNALLSYDMTPLFPVGETGKAFATSPSSVTIPRSIQNTLTSAKGGPEMGGHAETILIAISALDTHALQAHSIYKAPHMFIALHTPNRDGPARATIAGNGGQFIKLVPSLSYEPAVMYFQAMGWGTVWRCPPIARLIAGCIWNSAASKTGGPGIAAIRCAAP